MGISQTKTERDGKLDALKTATNEWFIKEQERLDNETKFLKAVQLGRGTSGQATKNFEVMSLKLIDEIDAFLLLG